MKKLSYIKKFRDTEAFTEVKSEILQFCREIVKSADLRPFKKGFLIRSRLGSEIQSCRLYIRLQLFSSLLELIPCRLGVMDPQT